MRVAQISAIAGLLLLCAAHSWAGEPTASRRSRSLTDQDNASFRKLTEAQKRIDPNDINSELLDAAVFHETNRRRQEQGLPALSYNRKAYEMARMQSQAMAEQDIVSHTNPADSSRRTLRDRATRAGLARAKFLGENVASAFGRRYKSGEKFYVQERDGRKVYSYEPNGSPIPMHTYVSFARAVVDGWMDSPGHRKNILTREAQHLACVCVTARSDMAMEKFYCTQVFVTP